MTWRRPTSLGTRSDRFGGPYPVWGEGLPFQPIDAGTRARKRRLQLAPHLRDRAGTDPTLEDLSGDSNQPEGATNALATLTEPHAVRR